ncbi:MAG: hypothetical protein K1W04_06020 [Oscillospiraceae bacterium]
MTMTRSEWIDYARAHLEVRHATQNGAYRAGRTIRPEGCVNHSLGVAQPSADVMYGRMDRTDAGWGVNAILGDFHTGEGRILLCMPYDRRPWGVGSGSRGSWNDSRIQWEVCEPAGHTYAGGTMVGYDVVKNQDYFDRMWKLLVAWNVFMAVELGYDAATINDHAESYRAGMGSNHADMGQWLPKHGKSMNHLRHEVQAILDQKEEDTVTEEQVRQIVAEELKRLLPPQKIYTRVDELPQWAQPSTEELLAAGILRGNQSGLLQLTDDDLKWVSALARLLNLVERTQV